MQPSLPKCLGWAPTAGPHRQEAGDDTLLGRQLVHHLSQAAEVHSHDLRGRRGLARGPVRGHGMHAAACHNMTAGAFMAHKRLHFSFSF